MGNTRLSYFKVILNKPIIIDGQVQLKLTRIVYRQIHLELEYVFADNTIVLR